MKLAALGALVLTSALAAATASAQQWPTTDPTFTRPDGTLATPVEMFGTPGQIVITSDFDIDLRYVSEAAGDLSVSGPDITVAPSLMFFIAHQIAVGGILGFHHEGKGDATASSFIFGPTLALNIPIGARASILPTAGVTYIWQRTSLQLAGGKMTSASYDFGLLLKAPLLFHPFPHVLVGFGPIIIVDFASKVETGTATKTRSFGLTLDFGFWL